jgi:hypothetical protein
METAIPPPAPEEPKPPHLSLISRLSGVYATPDDVFTDLKGTEPHFANWLLPVLMAAVMGIIYAFVVLSQPSVQQQMREQQDAALQKMVDAGKLSAADAEAARERMEQFGAVFAKAAGAIASVVASFVWLFVAAAVLKLLARVLFGQSVPYMKLVEVAGLSSMILVLGSLIQMLLVILTGNMLISPGPALLIRDFDPQNKLHLLVASISLTTLWYIAVLALGLARCAGGSFWKAVSALVALWGALRLGVVLLGVGQHGW